MKDKQNSQGVNENNLDFRTLSRTINKTGVLPAIIADGTVFNGMSNNERSRFYRKVDELIPDRADKRSASTIKIYCLYPEAKLNNAFVREDGRADEDSWHLWVGVLEHALIESIAHNLETFDKEFAKLHHEYMTVKKRKEELEEAYQKYCSPQIQNQ
jgi:hypothetical protein